MQISNFRCFDSLSIDFDEQLTVLVAENGVGKTAILDAIAIAHSPFLRGIDAGIGKGFKPEDARLIAQSSPFQPLTPQKVIRKRMEPQFPIALTAKGIIDDQSVEWSRELTGKKTQTTFGKARILADYAKKLQQLVRNGEQVELPIIAYYGTGRLWKQAQPSNKKSIESQSRMYGYRDALNPDATYTLFEKWFTEASLAEAHYYVSFITSADMSELWGYKDVSNLPRRSIELEHVRKAIDQCLAISGWNALEYNFELRDLVLHHVGNDSDTAYIPVAQLSDGVKAMLSLTADIAYRCVQLNPHLASPTEETKGIVLIDEIDLHLHPKWQQTVLVDLCKAFPKIQFIVTTHSPQVLTTVQAKCIRLLYANGDVVTPEINPYGEESKVALEDIMHTSSRPHTDEADLLQRYLQRINQGDIDSPEVIKWRQILEYAFGSEYSKLKLADMVISKWKAKRGME